MISSTHNPTVRSTAKLRKRRERDKRRAFLVEGHRAVSAAVGAGVRLPLVFHTPAAAETRRGLIEEARGAGAKIAEVSPAVMGYLTNQDHAPDVLAVAPMRPARLAPALQTDLVVVLDGVRDPSVAGGIMAAAAGAAAGAVVATAGTTDVFAPACVRAAAGAHFVLKVAAGAAPGDVASAPGRVLVLGDDGVDVAKAELGRPLTLVVHDDAAALDEAYRGIATICVASGPGGVRAGLAARAAIALHEVNRA